MKKISQFILILISVNFNIEASGFQINEHGSKGMGMGGAFVGLANDPSAVYFNPSGITNVTGTQILLGTTLILPSSNFRGPTPNTDEYKLENQLFCPIHLYATNQYNDKLFFGFGVGNNFGLGTKWEDDWVGKYLAVETQIRTFFFNFVAAYQIINEVSIGFGYVFTYGEILISKSLNLSPFDADSYLELEGNGFGSGFTAGILFNATKALSIGISYRSQVTINFEGDAKSSDYPIQFDGQLPNGAISAPLTTPENITLGIALKPLKYFTITADYQYVGWDSYKKLEISFEDFIDSRTGELMVSSSERNYNNGFIARVGAEFKYNRSLDIYTGFLYDANPISDERLDPTLPDSDRLGFSGGFNYKLSNKISLQASYLLLQFTERKIISSLESYSGIQENIIPMNGEYNSTVHLFSLTLVYKI